MSNARDACYVLLYGLLGIFFASLYLTDAVYSPPDPYVSGKCTILSAFGSAQHWSLIYNNETFLFTTYNVEMYIHLEPHKTYDCLYIPVKPITRAVFTEQEHKEAIGQGKRWYVFSAFFFPMVVTLFCCMWYMDSKPNCFSGNVSTENTTTGNISEGNLPPITRQDVQQDVELGQQTDRELRQKVEEILQKKRNDTSTSVVNV
jgi:hypothetical protein